MFVWTGILSGVVPVFNGRIHNIVDVSHVPCRTILLLYRIKHLSLSYDNLQPSSHNIFMDTKEVWDRPDTTCACVAAMWGHVRYNSLLCVDYSVLPSVICMTRGRVA